MFSIYINDFPDNIKSTFKIFADDTSLFSHVLNKDTLQDELKYDLQKVSYWGFHWKMKFNLDPNRQAQELTFSKKVENNNFLPLTFNKTELKTCQSEKHLGLILDERLNFTEYINSKTSKCYKLIGITKTSSIRFPRNALLRIYKSFVGPHLDYADIIYDRPKNASFKSKIENV